MTQGERLEYLLHALLQEAELGPDELPAGENERRLLLRGLMNIRPPHPVDPDVLAVQDAFLQAELAEKRITDGHTLPPTGRDPRLSLWQGDITTLKADAIVNAANGALLGCFHPCHNCIDNHIHTAAGMQLRQACAALMEAQGHEEPPGRAKITEGYQLPARYVLHTVGPIVGDTPLTSSHRALLASCYRSCLNLAEERSLSTVAFCCISTGVYRFPRQTAAEIAVGTVQAVLNQCRSVQKVIFNVFRDDDYSIYRRLLL